MRLSLNSIFRYRGWDRKVFKSNKGYHRYVNDHHVIPKQHRNHNVIKKTRYDINGNFNLFIMPTDRGKEHFNLHPDTLVHKNHNYYNIYVKEELDNIYDISRNNDEMEYELWLFVCFLKDNLVFNKLKIPWN